MMREMTFELDSSSPIEFVYGLSESSLNAIKSGYQDAEGYDWCPILESNADCFEEFLSGVDIDDARLIVTDDQGIVSEYRFLQIELCEYEEDLADVIQFESSAYIDAGHDLKGKNIDWIIVARLDLKHRIWKSSFKINGALEKSNFTVKLKNRDSDLRVASEVYNRLPSTYENSLVALYYSGEEVPFILDYTSYPPEFLCLKRTSKGWTRDEKLETFFTGEL